MNHLTGNDIVKKLRKVVKQEDETRARAGKVGRNWTQREDRVIAK